MLPELAIVLIALHGLGAALGAGGALFAEIFYAKATADGRVDHREHEWFHATFFALRWGMTLVLLSGIALVVVQYFLPNSPERVLHPALWAQNALSLLILGLAYALTKKRISWQTGAATIFAAWWMLFLLDVWQGSTYPFFLLCVLFVLMAAASFFFWSYIAVLARARALSRVVRELRREERHRHAGR